VIVITRTPRRTSPTPFSAVATSTTSLSRPGDDADDPCRPFPRPPERLAKASLAAFYRLREFRGIEKKPATRELINWVRALRCDPTST